MNWEGLEDRVNRDRLIARFAGGASFRCLVRSGADEREIRLADGRMAPVARGPFATPQCDFALTGAADAWHRFAMSRPAPGDQDLFGFFRRGEIALAGDARKFYAHLLCLKLILEQLRAEA